MMEKELSIEELINALRRGMVETGSLLCLGCGHEHNCSTHGCAIMRQAADALEQLNDFEHSQLAEMLAENTRMSKELDAERHRQSIMDKETETALIFAATIIMQQVCSNQRLSKAQRDKMRRYALILKGLADKEEA